MLLFLLRHADAESRATSDSQRKLTAKGVIQAGLVGRFCKHYELVPSRILTSPYERAMQTAFLAAKELGDATSGPEVVTAPFLASGMRPEFALDELRRHAKIERMMLVGHEPDLSDLVSHLVGCVSPFIHIRKASLTFIELPSLSPGSGILHFSIPVQFMFP
jgi:phosphohistidine phosphatase